MLFNIQALRALAALLVVAVHLELLAGLCGLPKGVTVAGNSGVDLFFVISGLIMVVTTTERRQRPSEFVVNRVTRIVPLYWAITLLTFGLALAAPALFESTRASVPALFKSLAFVPYARPDGLMRPIVFVGWTLNYEMMFYLVFALGMLAPGPRLLGRALTVLALGLSVAAGLLLGPTSPVAEFYTAPLILEFGGGMLLGGLFVSGKLPCSPALRLPAVAVGAGAIALMLVGPVTWPDLDRSVTCGLPAVLIVGCALIAERSGLELRAGWLQLLGAASYSIYLTHFFSTEIAVHVAPHVAPLGALAVIVLALATYLSVVLVGLAVHLWGELPLTALARRLSRRIRKLVLAEAARADHPAATLMGAPLLQTDAATSVIAVEQTAQVVAASTD